MTISLAYSIDAQRMLDEADGRWDCCQSDRQLVEILAVWFANRGSTPPR